MSQIKSSANKRRGMKRLSNVTEPIIADATENQGALYTQICSLWPNIAKEMAEWSYPKNLSFAKSTRHNGILRVWVTYGRGPEAQIRSQELLSAINMVCGFKAVGKIIPQQTFELYNKTSRLRHKSQNSSSHVSKTDIDQSALYQLQQQTNDLHSPDLRANLIKLGIAINSKNKHEKPNS